MCARRQCAMCLCALRQFNRRLCVQHMCLSMCVLGVMTDQSVFSSSVSVLVVSQCARHRQSVCSSSLRVLVSSQCARHQSVSRFGISVLDISKTLQLCIVLVINVLGVSHCARRQSLCSSLGIVLIVTHD